MGRLEVWKVHTPRKGREMRGDWVILHVLVDHFA